MLDLVCLLIDQKYECAGYQQNASFDYELLNEYEAGLMLTGTEVKTLKLGT
jgi:tmRNA-binding protein